MEYGQVSIIFFQTPLDIAKLKRNPVIINKFHDIMSSIHIASYEGKTENLSKLIQMFQNIDILFPREHFQKDFMRGSSPLHFAVLGNHIDIVEYLIKLKSNINLKNENVNYNIF